MKNWGGHFTPELGGHFELESGGQFKLELGGQFKLELGGQYHWNLQYFQINPYASIRFISLKNHTSALNLVRF